MSFNVHSRLFSAVMMAGATTFAMAIDPQPLIWTAVACVGGFVLGWLTPGRKTFRNVTEPYSRVPAYRCPCCGNRVLHERGGDEICPVCFWHDDGQDDHDADVVRGGPNKKLSLTAARENYKRIGAADPKSLPHVHPGKNEEPAS